MEELTPLSKSHIPELASIPDSNLVELKKLSKQLAETESTLSAFWHLSQDLKCIAKNGRFIKVNPSWTKILGYSQEELLSTDYKNFVHPEDIDSTIATEVNFAERKSIFAFRNRYKHKNNGSWVTIEWTATQDGDTIYASGTDKSLEIEQEAKYKKLLEDKVELMEAALRYAPFGIFLTDVEGECLYINKKWEELSGLNSVESQGKGWIAGLCDNVKEEVVKAWYKFAENASIDNSLNFYFDSCFHNRKTNVVTNVKIHAYFYSRDTTIGYIEIRPTLI